MTNAIRLFMCLLAALLSSAVWAQVPPLDDEQRESLFWALSGQADANDAAASDDLALDVLLRETGRWGTLMPRWSADPRLAPDPAPVDAFTAGDDGSIAQPGEPFVFEARFQEMEPVAGRPTVQRWLVEPINTEVGGRAERAAVVYIDRRATGRIREPQPGWYVRVAGYYLRDAALASRDGTLRSYPVFVGAAFTSQPGPGGDLSANFAWLGIGIAVVIAIGVVLIFVVSKAAHARKKRDQEAPAE
jgi:hypothetical protein